MGYCYCARCKAAISGPEGEQTLEYYGELLCRKCRKNRLAEIKCSECKKEIPKDEFVISKNKFGRALCGDCQIKCDESSSRF